MSPEPSSGPPLRWFEYVLALLPFVLAFTGAIGLAVGPAACALNLTVMRSPRRRAIKVTMVIGVTLLAVVAWECVARLLS
jgi:hypothetical protein